VSLVDRVPKDSVSTLHVVIKSASMECGLSVVETGGQIRWCPESLLSAPLTNLDGVHEVCQQWVEVFRRLQGQGLLPPVMQIRVLVADGCLALLGVPWSHSLKGAASALMQVRQKMFEAGFTLAEDDVLRLDDAPFGVPRLAIAYPAVLLAACYGMAEQLQARLESLLPFSVAGWQALPSLGIRNVRALLILDEGQVSVARTCTAQTARLGEVSLRPVGHQATATGLTQVWQRLSLREPWLANLTAVPVLDLRSGGTSTACVPQTFVLLPLPEQEGAAGALSPALRLAGRLPSIGGGALDAVFSQARSGIWSRLALLGMAFLAASTCFEAIQAHMDVDAAQNALNATVKVRHVSMPAPAWSREELAQINVVNGAIRTLNMPIHELLRALEPPKNMHVAVLSLEVSSAQVQNISSVKIIAEAKTSIDMPHYVAYLAEHKPFEAAYLVRHEMDDSNPEKPYRFTVEALWSD
jgi:hypothetical protein